MKTYTDGSPRKDTKRRRPSVSQDEWSSEETNPVETLILDL